MPWKVFSVVLQVICHDVIICFSWNNYERHMIIFSGSRLNTDFWRQAKKKNVLWKGSREHSDQT